MLKQPGFAELAQAFVEATSPLVSNRTINIMDLDGTIIASTEKERIGTYHHGARLVAETGKSVIIDSENVKDYPGAKEGANLPIIDQGKLIGVVGLFGKETEIREAANLLRVYVTQFFRQQSWFREKDVSPGAVPPAAAAAAGRAAGRPGGAGRPAAPAGNPSHVSPGAAGGCAGPARTDRRPAGTWQTSWRSGCCRGRAGNRIPCTGKWTSSCWCSIR